MRETICVLDIHIDHCTLKQALKTTIGYLETEGLNIVELIGMDEVMWAAKNPEFRETIAKSDLILPGEEEILEAAGDERGRPSQAVEGQLYLKMILRYLHKNHSRVYLLVETEEEVDELTECLASDYRGIQLAGAAKVAEDPGSDEMVINAINGGEVDCVIAVLPAPVQEEFIARNRSLMNARMWLGAGKAMAPIYSRQKRSGRILRFFDRLFFKREIEKNRNKL